MKLNNKYYILRHGQTIYQTKKRAFTYPKHNGPSIKLTKKGEKQIKEAAKKLKKKKIDIIFSSDFFRTKQTAKIVAKVLGVKRIIFDKGLRDINHGVWRGKIKDDFYKHFPRYSKERFYKRPKGGENWRDAQRRMLKALKSIDKKHRDKTILIVGHGDPLWLLEGSCKNFSPEKMLQERMSNYIKVGELRKLNN